MPNRHSLGNKIEYTIKGSVQILVLHLNRTVLDEMETRGKREDYALPHFIMNYKPSALPYCSSNLTNRSRSLVVSIAFFAGFTTIVTSPGICQICLIEGEGDQSMSIDHSMNQSVNSSDK